MGDLLLVPLLVFGIAFLTADEHGVSLVSPVASGRYDWSVFRRIDETERAFLLDTGAGVAMMVSKRGMSDADVSELRALALKKGVLRPTTGGARATARRRGHRHRSRGSLGPGTDRVRATLKAASRSRSRATQSGRSR